MLQKLAIFISHSKKLYHPKWPLMAKQPQSVGLILATIWADQLGISGRLVLLFLRDLHTSVGTKSDTARH